MTTRDCVFLMRYVFFPVPQHYYGASLPFPPPSVREAGNTERGNVSHISGCGGGWAPAAVPSRLMGSSSALASPPKLTYVQLLLQLDIVHSRSQPPGSRHESLIVA